MVSTLYEKTWPVNLAEQRSLLQRILQRTQDVCVRSQPIFLKQATEPTRSEWETAFVAQTGASLPVPPGVKLIWMDILKGECKSFTTTNDGSNGLSSLGNIYKYIDTTWDRPSIRLLGYASPNNFPYTNQSGNPDFSTPIRMLPADRSRDFIVLSLGLNQTYEWAQRGLTSIIILYKIRGGGSAGETLRLVFSDRPINGEYQFYEESPVSDPNQMGFASLTFTNGGVGFSTSETAYSNLFGFLPDANALANAYGQGVIFLENWVQKIRKENGEIVLTDVNVSPAGVHFGTDIGTGLTTNQVALIQSVAMKYDEFHPRSGFGLTGVDLNSAPPSGEVWLYGLFKNLTGELS
jgi:hypothetical protein